MTQIADCAAARIQRRRVRRGRINEYRPAARPPIASSREAAGKGHDEVMDPYTTPQQRHPGGTPEPRWPGEPGSGPTERRAPGATPRQFGMGVVRFTARENGGR